MLEKIYSIRQKLKEFYVQYDAYVTPALKALAMLFILLIINSQIGYSETMTSWNIVTIAVLVAALLPWSAMTGIAALFALVNLYALSWEVALVMGAFMFIAAIMQYIFLPKFGLAIVLIPVFYVIKMPYMIPLIIGLLGGVSSFIPAGVGAFFYYFIEGIQKNADYFMRTSGSGSDVLERFPQIFSIIKDNQLLLISVIAFSFSALLVYVVKKFSTDYSQIIATAVGTISIIVIYLIGGFVSDVTVPYLETFIGCVLGFVITSATVLWLNASDYNHTEYLQYEDDDYTYYVKAVPKIKVIAEEVKVHDITADDDDLVNLDSLIDIGEPERKDTK